MSMDIWFKDDIKNVILGIAMATPQMALDRPSGETEAFQSGYLCALSALATSLGIEQLRHPAPSLQPSVRVVWPELSDGRR